MVAITNQKIGLFGGTFDPIHFGHLHLATLARDALKLDKIRFIPCRVSPHKTSIAQTSPEDRLEMLRLATQDLQWAIVDDIELTSTQPNYSYLTAETMAARYPRDDLFWILGGDQWAALDRWMNPGKLAETVQFIVMTRDGQTPMPRNGYRMHAIRGTHPASATRIREELAEGLTSSWLPKSVADYIEQRRLYVAG